MRRPNVVLVLAVVAALVALAGLGLGLAKGGHSSTTVIAPSTTPSTTTSTAPGVATVPAKTIAQRCPPGGGYMSCSINGTSSYTPPSLNPTPTETVTPPGSEFPDVSNYQGCDIDWANVGASGAAIKLGEGNSIVDACAAHNIAGLRASHKALVYYWFVRPDGTTPEAAYIVRTLKAERLTVDHVVIYTAPGTWPGGPSNGLDTWEAAYSGTLSPPALPYHSGVLAWQFTDAGSISGLGQGDVSVNYGLLALAPHALVLDEEVPGIAGYAPALASYVLKHDPTPRPKTYACKPFKAQGSHKACDALKRNRVHFEREIAAQRRLLRSQHCYAHRSTGKCPTYLKRGNQEHAALNRLLATSRVQP